MKRFKGIILATAFLIFSLVATAQTETAPPKSLYERLGSINAIASVVDDFVDNLLKDATITANESVVQALGNITVPGLKYHVTTFIAQATGGQQKYTGKSMKDSHAALGINESQWQITVKILVNSLNKFNVPETEQEELLAIVSTTKPDIVTAKETPKPLPAPEAQVAPPVDTAAQAAPPAEPEGSSKNLPQIIPPANAAPEDTLEEFIPEEEEISPEAQAAPPAEPEEKTS